MTDLRALIKNQILDQVVKGVQTDSGWKVLIVDPEALKMISSCCRMFDLTDNGVTIVEDLTLKRQPMLDIEAVYLCTPSAANASLIRGDFVPKAKYKAAHIFFIDAAEDAVIAQLAHPSLKAHVRNITELNMNFVPREPAVFTLDMPNGLHDYYSPRSKNNKANVVAAKIASVCAALGEIPTVRFTGGSAACEGLARQVQERVEMLAQFDDGMARKKSQLLIVDRGEDLAAPLVHELTYQCAVYDFLNRKLDGDVYTHEFQDGAGKTRSKRVVLGDGDEVWDEFKHTHIAEVGEAVAKRFKEFQKETEAQVVTGDTTTPEGKQKALKAMMQAAPQRKAKTEQFSLHLSMAAAIASGNPPEPAAFGPFSELCVQAEQNILTGIDGQGKKVKSHIGELGAFIGDRGPTQEKLRALAVCVVAAGGLPDAELNRLYDLAEVGFKDRKAVKNMSSFGVLVGLQPRERPAKPRSRMDTGNPALTQYFTSRWTPVVKDFMVGAVTGALDTRTYPAVKGTPQAMVEAGSGGEEVQSARKGKRNWAKNRNKADEDPAAAAASGGSSRNRLIVFIPGAVGYNEIRCAYEVGKQYDVDVIIGSHTISPPQQFLQQLMDLDEAPVADVGAVGVGAALEGADRGIEVVKGQTLPKGAGASYGI